MKRIFLSVIAGALLVAGCSNTDDKKSVSDADKEISQEMKRVEGSELLSADVSLATDNISHTAIYNTYEGLYRYGDENQLVPAGAESSANVSDDGLTYTFKLNKKATWSDGEPVTAKDYVYSWQRTINPTTGSEYASMLSPIKNATKILGGELESDKLGVRANGDNELVVELENPTPYFESLLPLPTFAPQREDIVKKYGVEYATSSDKAVYNGAFVLSDYDLKSGGATKWTYKKNENYWDNEKVSLNKIENITVKDAGTAFSMYENGEVDETYLFGEYVKQNKDNKDSIVILKPVTYYVQYNLNNKTLSNTNARKALATAINKKDIVNSLLANGSTIIDSYVPKHVHYNAETKEDFADTFVPDDNLNIEELWDKVENTNDLTIEILVADDEGIKKIAEYLQQEYQDKLAGLTVKVTPVPAQNYMERLSSGQFDITISAWQADYPDATTFLNNQLSSNPFNFGKYNNSEYDALMNSVNEDTTMNEQKRWDTLVKANQLMLDEQPVTPIFQQAIVKARNPEFTNIQTNTFGSTFDFKEAKRK